MKLMYFGEQGDFTCNDCGYSTNTYGGYDHVCRRRAPRIVITASGSEGAYPSKPDSDGCGEHSGIEQWKIEVRERREKQQREMDLDEFNEGS